MEFTTPQVELIAETRLEEDGIRKYLSGVGATEYELDPEISDIENLVMVSGKACYKSFQVGLNPNVTKVRNDSLEYLDNINKVGHGSVIEHGSVTFAFWNVSRVFTHELVRHRAGTAMSQESLRYVRLTKLGFWIPEILKTYDKDGEGVNLMVDTVKMLEEKQKQLAEIYGIENIKDFSTKKKLTSAFRRIAPIGLSTAIIWTMNMRAARHLIQIRTSRHAEEEIRLVFDQVAKVLVSKFPGLLGDLKCEIVDGIGEWSSKYASMPYDQEKITKLENENKSLKKQLEDLQKASIQKNLDLER